MLSALVPPPQRQQQRNMNAAADLMNALFLGADSGQRDREEDDYDYEEEEDDYYDDHNHGNYGGYGHEDDADFAPFDFRVDDRDDFVDDDDGGIEMLYGADLRLEGGLFSRDEDDDLVGVWQHSTIIPPHDLVEVQQHSTITPPPSKEAKEGEEHCYVCFSNVPNAKFTDCGHSSICTVCADRLIRSSANKCPLCRGTVTAFDIIVASPAAGIRDAWDD
jgi:hypothetical protein